MPDLRCLPGQPVKLPPTRTFTSRSRARDSHLLPLSRHEFTIYLRVFLRTRRGHAWVAREGREQGGRQAAESRSDSLPQAGRQTMPICSSSICALSRPLSAAISPRRLCARALARQLDKRGCVRANVPACRERAFAGWSNDPRENGVLSHRFAARHNRPINPSDPMRYFGARVAHPPSSQYRPSIDSSCSLDPKLGDTKY